MLDRKLLVFLCLLFLPLSLFAERPYLGVEEGFFFPRGDWGNKIGVTPSLRFTVHQKLIKTLSAGITAGIVTFNSDHPEGFDLSMNPLLYLDAIGEIARKKNPFFKVGLFIGSVYSGERIRYGYGIEKATIWGWSGGGLISLQYRFIKKAYFKIRFVSRAATGGIEYSLGINF